MKTNTKEKAVKTHEGAVAQRVSPELELRRSLMTCLLWENIFYEKGSKVAKRIADLVKEVAPQKVAEMAVEARSEMQLRHAPLFVARELARVKGAGSIVADLLPKIIQRADELSEFLSLYWISERQPIASAVKRGLAESFRKFNEYELAKYNRADKVKLRDVLFLVHAKPKDKEQAELWKRLVENKLETPDTWEVALSSGGDKKEVWERLLREKKLGGLAVLRNLRNMVKVKVDYGLIKERLSAGIKRALPYRFIAAAKCAPELEDEIGGAMLKSVSQLDKLPGSTIFVIDISGSMQGELSSKSDMDRIDAACGLAILLREICQKASIYATAGNDSTRVHATKKVPPRHGFALSDAIRACNSELGVGGIFLAQCMDFISQSEDSSDRVIVITDEQDCDRGRSPMSARKLGKHNYIINMVSYQYGTGYGNGWVHIDGWSERVIDYIRLIEKEGDVSSIVQANNSTISIKE